MLFEATLQTNSLQGLVEPGEMHGSFPREAVLGPIRKKQYFFFLSLLSSQVETSKGCVEKE